MGTWVGKWGDCRDTEEIVEKAAHSRGKRKLGFGLRRPGYKPGSWTVGGGGE